MKQIASGLRHLHGLGLVHRDIKPQNILISSSSSSKGPPYRMLISDFGLCKKRDIPSDQSRFVATTYGCIAQGTAGWMAPEMLKCIDDELEVLATSGDTNMSSTNNGSSSESGFSKTTCPCAAESVDIFALGCLFYYILTRGKHPYGHGYDREYNIRNEVKDLSLVYSDEEAHDLITHMLHRQPSDRLDIKTCLLHPFFWEPSKRLAFLRDASDRFEVMSKDPMDGVLIRLERDAKIIIETDWYHTLDQSQDQLLIKNLRKSRGYDGNSLRDLLRVLRNKVSFFHSYRDRYIYLLIFPPLYINRETITKTSPTISKSNWGPCQKDSLNISRVGIQDYSFMCMKWSKTQVYIRNPRLKTISSCQNVKLGSSLLILFYSLLCFSFLFANSLLSTCCSCSRYHSLPILHPAYIIPGFSPLFFFS